MGTERESREGEAKEGRGGKEVEVGERSERRDEKEVDN